MESKKKYIIIGSVAVVLVLVLTVAIIIMTKKDKPIVEGISRVEAAKMIMYAKASDEELNKPLGANWYDTYMDYMYENGLYDKNKATATYNGNYTALVYEDLEKISAWAGIDKSEVEKLTGITFDKKNKNNVVKKESFVKLYEVILQKHDTDKKVKLEDRIILGGKNQIDKLEEFDVYTTTGMLKGTGLNIDDKVDKKVQAYIRDKEIVYIKEVLKDTVIYENVWLVLGEENNVYAYMYDVFRNFTTDRLERKVESTLGDIVLNDGKVTQINTKDETIRGKVLEVTEENIEIEGYGKVPLSNNFIIYKNYGRIETKGLKDIVIGYELQDFVVAEGKICGAIIKRPLEADNIRVIVTDTQNNNSKFHSKIVLSATSKYKVQYGDNENIYEAGEKIEIEPSDTRLTAGRIKITPLTTGGKVTVESIKKNYGTPSYYGVMEVVKHTDGLLLINEVFIEEYLYGVVPNEMPASYGLEALKVQAVCARSYAYNQLQQNRYRAYGAHVDDTVSCQAYNNYKEQLVSNNAVRETYGEVLKKGFDVVTTYYYSTSCGYTTNLGIWHSNSNDDYIAATRLNPSSEAIDLTNEEKFAQFIKTVDKTDYESGFALYRWNAKVSLETISQMVNERLATRYKNSKAYILTLENGKYVSKEIGDIGNITKIETVKRLEGGVLDEIILHGTKASVKVISQANIRNVLGSKSLKLNNNSGGTTYSADLPSAFLYFEPYYEGENLAGYTFYGGGYGHGAGMSQNGAYAMTKAGMTYDQILYLFYKNTKIESVY